MATEAQISANRENSKVSTGPVTEQGKAIASRNHVVHGLCAADPVLPTEDRNAFNQLVEISKCEWQAETTHQEFLVRQMVGAQWKLDRVQRIETEMMAALEDPSKAFTDKQTAEGFNRLERYRASLERTYSRCARELRATQKEKSQFEAKIAKANEDAELAALTARIFAPVPQEWLDRSRQRDRENREKLEAERRAQQNAAANKP